MVHAKKKNFNEVIFSSFVTLHDAGKIEYVNRTQLCIK
jgi:hypothetical protein